MLVRFGVSLLLLLGVGVFASYDVSGRMSKVGSERSANQRNICRGSALFTVAGALEVANGKLTGHGKEFSVQEMVDCFHKSCMYPELNKVVDWLVLNDRLAFANKYHTYVGVAHTCRASTSPDGLTMIQVTGKQDINVEDFEEEIRRAGSVMACVDNTGDKCPGLDKDYAGGVLTGNPNATSNRCRKNVLIVGYNEEVYKVRSSDGSSWGEEGYFRIERGSNACGIEQFMSVLSVERRASRKVGVHPKTGCPSQFPRYCQETKTCRGSSQRCQPAMAQHARKAETSIFSGYQPSYLGRTKRNSESMCQDDPHFPCGQVTTQHCQNSEIRSRCRAACKLCNEDGSPKCPDLEDSPGECQRYAKYCTQVAGIAVKCAFTCGSDPADCAESLRPVIDPRRNQIAPPSGNCYTPRIPNGRAMNSKLMVAGEVLRVACRPGYTLIGQESTCELQNVFSPDTRRLPQCIILPSGNLEVFEGKGADYSGTRDITVIGQTCDNWAMLAHTGRFNGLDHGRLILSQGNHNFCRNLGGDDFAPSCYTEENPLKKYCWSMPKCGGNESDKCSAVKEDLIVDCVNRFQVQHCELNDERTKDRAEWFWDKCNTMCCQHAGC